MQLHNKTTEISKICWCQICHRKIQSKITDHITTIDTMSNNEQIHANQKDRK